MEKKKNLCCCSIKTPAPTQQTPQSKEQDESKKTGSTIVIIPGENEIFDNVTPPNSLDNMKGKDCSSPMVEDCNTYTTMKVPNWLIEGHEPKNVDSGLNFMYDWTKRNQICDQDVEPAPDTSTIIDPKNSADGSKRIPNWVIQGHAPIDVDHALCFMNQWTASKSNNGNPDNYNLSSKFSKPCSCKSAACKSKSTTGAFLKPSTCCECKNTAGKSKARIDAVSKTNTCCECKIAASKSKTTTGAISRTNTCCDCKIAASKVRPGPILKTNPLCDCKNPACKSKSTTGANFNTEGCCDCKTVALKPKTKEIAVSKKNACCDCGTIKSERTEDGISAESSLTTADSSDAVGKIKTKPSPIKKKLKTKKRKSKESQTPTYVKEKELVAQLFDERNSSSSLAEFTVYQGNAQIRKRANADKIKNMLSQILGIKLGDMYDIEIKSVIGEKENEIDQFCKCTDANSDKTKPNIYEVTLDERKDGGNVVSAVCDWDSVTDEYKQYSKPLKQKEELVIASQSPTLPSQLAVPHIQCCRCGRSNHVMNEVLKKLGSMRAAQPHHIGPSRSNESWE